MVAGDEKGIGDCGKSDGDGDKVGGQATTSREMARATVTRWRGPPRRQRLTSGAAGDNDRHCRGRRERRWGDNGPVLVAPFREIQHRQQIFLQTFLKNVVPLKHNNQMAR